MEELYLFRDHFFERHDAAEASSKDEKVEQQLQECLKKLDDIESRGSKTDSLYLKFAVAKAKPYLLTQFFSSKLKFSWTASEKLSVRSTSDL